MSHEAGNITIFHSPDLEPLLAHAAGRLSVPLADPFAKEIIVVPHSDMVRYLKRNLSHHLGATATHRRDGIVANVEFVYPRQLANASTSDLLGLSPSPWDAHRLTWSIAHVVKETNLEVPGFDRAPLSVSRRAADLFDRYASHRPEMLNHWRHPDGVLAGDQLSWLRPDGSQNWQQLLFAAVAERIDALPGSSTRASHNSAAFRQAVQSAAQANELPERITIFGINALSRASRHVLEILSDFCDISIYMVFAPHSSVPTLDDPGILVRPENGIGSLRHPLYRRWGVQAVEGAAGVSCAGSLSPLEPLARTDALLHRLQHDIITDIEHPPAPDSVDYVGAGDGSVQIHACYGLTRQAEAVRDALLHLFNGDPSLRLRDVAILCADVDASAPILNAVLNPPASSEESLPPLNIDVLGSQTQSADSLSEAFFSILRLSIARCSPSEILDVASLPPVSRHFGFTDDDIELISTWSEQLGVKYGIDGEHRHSVGSIPETIADGTWQSAMNRLFVGVAVPAEVDRVGPGGIVPYDGVSGNEIDTAGLVAEFIYRLKVLIESTSRSDGLTINEWRDTVMFIVDGFLSVSPSDTEKFVRLKSTLATIGEDAIASHVNESYRYPIADLMSLTSEYFADAFSVFGSKSEAITVASMSSLQHVPYRVVVLFGADESAFAGAHSDGDDVLSNTPCIGEPMYSLTGRQTLLNALMAARDALIITCTGADVSNNKDVPLAVPILELSQIIRNTIAAYGINTSQRLIAHHPRQNFDRRTLTSGVVIDGVPFTFDRRALTALDAIQNRTVSSASDVVNSVVDVIRPVRDLAQLVRAITNPSEFFVQNILGVTLPRMPETETRKSNTIVGDAIMNITTDKLQESNEGRDLLDRIIRRADDDSYETTIDNWQIIRPKTGILPPLKLGTLVVDDIASEVKAMIGKLPEHLRNFKKGTDTDCLVESPDGPVVLRVASVLEEEPQEFTIVRAQFKRFTNSTLLELWIEVAALTIHTQGALVQGYFITRDEKNKGLLSTLRMRGNNNDERLAHAQSVLQCVFTIFAAASREPLPLFEHASHYINSNGLRGAEKKFETDLQRSSAVRFLYEGRSFKDIAAIAVTEADQASLGSLLASVGTSRVVAYAKFLWSTYDATSSSSGGTSTDDASPEDGDES